MTIKTLCPLETVCNSAFFWVRLMLSQRFLFQRQRPLDAVNRPAVRVVEHRLQNLRNPFIRQVDIHGIMHLAVALDVVCNLSDRYIIGVSILRFQVCV